MPLEKSMYEVPFCVLGDSYCQLDLLTRIYSNKQATGFMIQRIKSFTAMPPNFLVKFGKCYIHKTLVRYKGKYNLL